MTILLSILFAILSFGALTFGTVNIGTSRLAGPALQAGAVSQVQLRDLDPGYVDCLRIHVAFGLVDHANPGAPFALAVSNGAAEGVDDCDLLLNGLFTNLSLYWESGNVAFNGLTPAQLRTWLIAANRRDIEGTLTNARQVPAHAGPALAIRATLTIPVSLRQYFDDGDVTGRGSHSLESGRIEFLSTASLTPAIVLTNGTADVSGLSVTIGVQYGDGDASDCGATWRVRRILGLKAQSERFVAATRIFMADVLTSATNTATAYSFLGFRNASPADLGSRFQSDRLQDGGGYDLTTRCTPLLFPSKKTQIADFANVASASFVWDVITPAATIGVYEAWLVDRDPSVAAAVAATIGKGGSVSHQAIYPRSIPTGGTIPGHLANIVKIRMAQGRGAGALSSSPVALATAVANTNAKAEIRSAAKNNARMRRR